MWRRTREFVVRHRTVVAWGTAGFTVFLVASTTWLLWPSPWTNALEAWRQPSETLRNGALILAAVLALPFAWWRAIVADKHRRAAEQQVEVTHRTRLDDRIQRAAMMLGSDSLSVRIAGVLSLESLASEWPQGYYIEVARLLCAFVRSAPMVRRRPYGTGMDDTTVLADVEHPGDDVMEALMSIGKRDPIRRALRDQAVKARPMDAYVARDFEGARLRGARMRYPLSNDFDHSNFNEADLSRCLWTGIDFRASMFMRAKLDDTSFIASRLDRSIFHYAELNGGVRFVGGSLVKADFSGASFSQNGTENRSPIFANDVNLSGVNLSDVVGLVQGDLEQGIAETDDPPHLEGARDALTGLQLEWPGRTRAG